MTTEHRAAGDLLPARIGRYRIVAQIGSGGMGIVYAALDEQTGLEVAVKIMPERTAGDPEARARFLREAQAAGALRHRNLVPIRDAGEYEGRVFLVMERLGGETLSNLLRRQAPLTLDQKLDLMIQVLAGLSAAHAAGVCHRDLKPGNIIIEPDGTARILDFGVAGFTGGTDHSDDGPVAGTPDYTSPEQARGLVADLRSDVFSAGAVFYHLLCGRKPFAGPDPAGVIRNVQEQSPVPLGAHEAPPLLAAIVSRSLEKSPDRRYRWAGELLDDIAQFRQLLEAERRRLAESARDRWREVEKGSRELASLERFFGLTPAAPGSTVIDALVAHSPVLAERGPDGLVSIPVSRDELASIVEKLEAEHGRLSTRIATLLSARSAMDAARRALASGRLDEALPLLEEVLRAVPTLERVRDAAERCRRALEAGRATKARSVQPAVPEPAPVQEQRAEPSEADAMAEGAREAVARARGVFKAGRHADALSALRAFRDAHASAPGVQEAIDGLSAELAQIVAEKRRRGGLDAPAEAVAGPSSGVAAPPIADGQPQAAAVDDDDTVELGPVRTAGETGPPASPPPAPRAPVSDRPRRGLIDRLFRKPTR